jgi:osmotically-inducible protein OsmY
MKILDVMADVATIGIADIAQRKLRESPYYFLKNLTCDYDDGVLTLRGRVPIGPLKQLAESIVCRVDGVQEVVNRVEVVDPTLGHARHQAVRNAG